MNRRRFLTTTTLSAASALFARNTRAQKNAAQRPNIVFFLIDDQRNTTLGCAGDPIVQTPNIDALAREGVMFSDAFVTTSICAASRASIFTGLTECTHGYTFGKPPVPEKFTRDAYPALLRRAGYRTGFVGKYGVKLEGFEAAGLFDYFKSRDRPYLRKQDDGTVRHIDEINTEQAIEFVRSCSSDTPFCLSVSFSSTHAEDRDKENHYPCIDAVKGMYEDVTFPEPRLNDPEIFESQPDFLKNSLNRVRYFWRWDTPEKYQKNMRAYYRLITGVDVMIGRILDELDKNGLADNTIVMYIGDNGYYMGDRGFAGKWSHYEQSLRVPLIVFDPRQPERRRVDAMALNIDIPPTILELAGVKAPGHYQGRSLKPFVDGAPPDHGERTLRWREDFFVEHRMGNDKIPKWEGVHDRRYVYARYYGQEPPYEFLHDLERDPDQLENFAGNPDYAATLSRLRKRCDHLRTRYIEARDND